MIHAARALVAAGLLVSSLNAGAARADGNDAQGPSGTVAEAPDGAVAEAPSGARIVNGIPTHLQPTTGALLFVGPDTKNQFLDCSGVLIGCRTVLTAAHCICKNSTTYEECVNSELPALDVADLRFFLQHTGIHHVREVYIDPAYSPGKSHDLAVLRLSELVTGVEPARYHKSFPFVVPDGAEGVISGFGNSGDDELDAAIKRVGSVEIASCPAGSGVTEPTSICWNYTGSVSKPGDESNLCLKDDGGPLFVDFGNGPEVTGVHVGSGSTCDAATYSYDTNVSVSRDWIAQIGGLDIARDQCSDLGEVGEPWVVVKGGEGNMPRSEDEKLFAFDVPQDALLVRVTINGDTEKDGDYDMFVGLGQKVPTRLNYDCASRGVGQFGACAFEEPETNRVNVLVRHVHQRLGKGRSRFQVTVTAYRPVPPHDDPPRGPDNLRYEKRGPGLRRLKWIDDSANEKGFELQRRPGSDPTGTFVKRRTIGADRESVMEDIADDQVFTYRIRAFNDFGASEWSNICVVNKPRLGRPTRLRSPVVAAHSVELRWRDNADGESHMELQRRPAGAIKWKTIKVLPPDTRTFTDDEVDNGKSYQYRVRAKGFLEQCIEHSRWSRVLDVTTP